LDSSKRVLVIGDIILEKYVHGTYNRTSPENSMPIFRIEKEEYRLAGTGNIIRNLLIVAHFDLSDIETCYSSISI
jgi:D-beta-D-heptose 7-phosphate kinase/D-beta-D-heptose 1-phosphate adenosyltransferase